MRNRRVAVRLPSTAAMRAAVVAGCAVGALSMGQVLSSGLNVTVSEVPYSATVGASAADVAEVAPAVTRSGEPVVAPQPSNVAASPAESAGPANVEATPTQAVTPNSTPTAEPTAEPTTASASPSPEPTTSPVSDPPATRWSDCVASTAEPVVSDPSFVTLDCGAAQLKIPAPGTLSESATPGETAPLFVTISDETQIGKTVVLGNRTSPQAEPVEISRVAVAQLGDAQLQLPPNGVTGDEHWTLALL